MEKFRRVLKQSKKFLIVIAVLWIILAIVLVAPVAQTIQDATMVSGRFNMNIFIENIGSAIASFSSITKVFGAEYIETYFTCLGYFTIAFVLFSIIGFIKSKPKSEFHDIEHGSSDWCEHGEQYRILSKNKGLILAEDNYLPIDKRGNINTLIVGRIRFW